MGRYDFRPARVQQAAAQLLHTERIAAPPPWYDVVKSIPPPQILVRTQPVQHTGHRKGVRKPSKLFQPQKVTYPEDQLRRTFFTDHPWELARPRVLLEDSGADWRGQEWSSIRRRGGHISGENVVQRQVWLMEQKNLTKDEAYEQARREFYEERLREDVERRVAKEEATSTGAYFGKTMIGIGNDLEDQQFDKFRAWAEKTVTEQEQSRSASSPSRSAVNTDSVVGGTEAFPDPEQVPASPEGALDQTEN